MNPIWAYAIFGIYSALLVVFTFFVTGKSRKKR